MKSLWREFDKEILVADVLIIHNPRSDRPKEQIDRTD